MAQDECLNILSEIFCAILGNLSIVFISLAKWGKSCRPVNDVLIKKRIILCFTCPLGFPLEAAAGAAFLAAAALCLFALMRSSAIHSMFISCHDFSCTDSIQIRDI